MLSRELEVTLNFAFKEARAKRHELMSVEHLLLSLLDNTAAVAVLRVGRFVDVHRDSVRVCGIQASVRNRCKT